MTTNKQFQTEFQDNHAKTQELVEEYERINFGAPNIHSSYNILKVAFFFFLNATILVQFATI